jgi:hypothetical protein
MAPRTTWWVLCCVLPLLGCWGVGGRAAVAAASCTATEVPWPDPSRPGGVECQPQAEAAAQAHQYLAANMFAFDKANADTIADGVFEATINRSLAARQRFAWAAAVPREVWLRAVLPYASVNEARTDWRALLWRELTPLLNRSFASTASLPAAATLINDQMWGAEVLGRFHGGDAPIRFQSDSTPVVFDPMSTMLFGFASCTGVSIMYVDALRTLGVPARLAGTPAWHGNASLGNHNWCVISAPATPPPCLPPRSRCSRARDWLTTPHAADQGGDLHWGTAERPHGGWVGVRGGAARGWGGDADQPL